jgi:hypothetical protein
MIIPYGVLALLIGIKASFKHRCTRHTPYALSFHTVHLRKAQLLGRFLVVRPLLQLSLIETIVPVLLTLVDVYI